MLRYHVDDDLDAVFAFQSRDDVTRYVSYSSRTREEVRNALERRKAFRAIEKDGDVLIVAVIERESGALIGEIDFWVTSMANKQGGFGYVFHPDFSGKGYATEAARAVLDIAFDVYDMHKVIADCDVRNAPSYRLMERLGMRREAHFIENEWFKGEWSSSYIYAMLAHEWKANK